MVYLCANGTDPRSARSLWDKLYETAAAQDGMFTAAQAAMAGYSPQLLTKYLRSRTVARVRRGIYRLVHFPAGEHEDLVAFWLWTERAGVFSHETALALHGLSDALPSRANLTLPLSWQKRRLRVPDGLALGFADIAGTDRTWVGALPTTTIERTLADCAAAKVAPELVRDAFEEAASRGLIGRDSAPAVIGYLERFYSVSRSRSGPRFASAAGSHRGSRSGPSPGSRS